MTKREFDLIQEEKYKEEEALCKRCGACCGVLDGNPCSHLISTGDGKYACSIYEKRFGLRRTKKGTFFLCVPIRNVLHNSWTGSWNCAYKKLLK